MAKQYYSPRNLKFLLHEVFNAKELTKLPHYKDHDNASFDMVIDAARQIADNILHPAYIEMDTNEPQLKDNKLTVHPAVKAYLKAMGDAGMIGAT